jgi:3-oxoacyl-[acyl-carrier-protein] synthase-3
LKDVYINRISNFFPNEPVFNDEMENYLGMIGNSPSKSKAIVLRNNGIKRRFYSFDKNGKSTHTSAQMASLAIEKLFDEQVKKEDIDFLACGSSTPDSILPSHASLVHGELKMQPLEILAPGGSCCTGIQSMLFAYLYIKLGMKKNAITCGSEKPSQLMLARNFQPESDNHVRLEQNPIIAFEKDFLRWMLSDGAGAALLQDKPNSEGLSLKIDWIESKSYAGHLDTCMYFGSKKNEKGELIGWAVMEPQEWLNDSVFSMKQDTKLLAENIVPLGGIFLKELCEKYNSDVSTIKYFCPHLSSGYFKQRIYDELKKNDMEIPLDKWFTNLEYVGNMGCASIFIMLEELFNNNKIQKGDKILCMVPESARFSYAYMLLTAV